MVTGSSNVQSMMLSSSETFLFLSHGVILYVMCKLVLQYHYDMKNCLLFI